MPKLTMLRGLPASGKTTLARQLVRETGNTGRVNRDDLRAMLFDSAWTGKREEAVITCEKAIAEALFNVGMNAVIDDTNLTAKHRAMWEDFAKQRGQHFECKNLDVDIVTCIDRDAAREKSIGEAVITRLAATGGMIPWGEKEIILCDIDGTIADGTYREHLVQGETKNWDAYYALLHLDAPIHITCAWLREEMEDRTIVLISGRPDTYQRETIQWLDRWGIPYDYIFMRGGGDKRPDTLVKADILKLLPKEKIVCVIDDRPSVIRMWKENGLRVVAVRGACEEF
jgi:predicted kinase